MVTAHVVVLQLLLAGFIASHNVGYRDTGDLFAICSVTATTDAATANGADQPAPQRQHHQPCTLCPTGTLAAAVLPDTAIRFAAVVFRAVSFAVVSQDVHVALHPTPRLSQGPPSIA